MPLQPTPRRGAASGPRAGGGRDAAGRAVARAKTVPATSGRAAVNGAPEGKAGGGHHGREPSAGQGGSQRSGRRRRPETDRNKFRASNALAAQAAAARARREHEVKRRQAESGSAYQNIMFRTASAINFFKPWQSRQSLFATVTHVKVARPKRNLPKLKALLFQDQSADGEAPVDLVVEAFEEIDQDASGSISLEELANALCDVGLEVDTDACSTIMSEMDRDGSRHIDVEEFVEFFRAMEELQRYQEKAEFKSALWSKVCFFVFCVDVVVGVITLLHYARQKTAGQQDSRDSTEEDHDTTEVVLVICLILFGLTCTFVLIVPWLMICWARLVECFSRAPQQTEFEEGDVTLTEVMSPAPDRGTSCAQVAPQHPQAELAGAQPCAQYRGHRKLQDHAAAESSSDVCDSVTLAPFLQSNEDLEAAWAADVAVAEANLEKLDWPRSCPLEAGDTITVLKEAQLLSAPVLCAAASRGTRSEPVAAGAAVRAAAWELPQQPATRVHYGHRQHDDSSAYAQALATSSYSPGAYAAAQLVSEAARERVQSCSIIGLQETPVQERRNPVVPQRGRLMQHQLALQQRHRILNAQAS